MVNYKLEIEKDDDSECHEISSESNNEFFSSTIKTKYYRSTVNVDEELRIRIIGTTTDDTESSLRKKVREALTEHNSNSIIQEEPTVGQDVYEYVQSFLDSIADKISVDEISVFGTTEGGVGIVKDKANMKSRSVLRFEKDRTSSSLTKIFINPFKKDVLLKNPDLEEIIKNFGK